jgi:molecular chaperone DnaK
MGTQRTVTLTDVEVSPEQISAYILAEMRRQIETVVETLSSSATRWIVDRAIVTVPAYFDQPQVDATASAAHLAGLDVLDLLHEPTAAACYHCWQTGSQDGVFLVYDLGGGTFDVSVLRSTAGVFEVLGISGNNHLGGDDFDAALARELQDRLVREGYALDLDLANNEDDRLRFEQLKFLAEGVKKSLSTAHEYVLRDTSLRDQDDSPVIIDTQFERADVEALLRPLVERTIPYCFEALERAHTKAGITLANVDAVILAGGSTHVPLVREMVRQNLCAADDVTELVVDPRASEGRARCAMPIYDKVDTIVALGAAIRAAAVGGLAVFNADRSIRIAFRGTASTGGRETSVGGKVEPLSPGINLVGGRVQLRVQDVDYDDVQDLSESGTFAFRRVPLQAGAENLLSFEVFDQAGVRVATAGRPISQSQEPQRPTGGSASTAVLAKAILLEVERDGKPFKRTLFEETQSLPQQQSFSFSHPGNTELVRFPLYQRQRKIKEIAIPVDASLPKGTPVTLDVDIDELLFITVKGDIGGHKFDALVTPPPERPLPSAEDAAALERKFREAVGYLPAGRRNVAEAKFKKIKASYDAAVQRADSDQALHDFEELEELVAESARADAALQPPKEAFAELVAECHELNSAVARMAAEAGNPHDHQETAKAIEAQRQQGERAIAASDQNAYSDAFRMLEALRNHIVALGRKAMPAQDPRSDSERASDHVQVAQGEAGKVEQLASSQGRADLQQETQQILSSLAELSRDAQRDPRSVQEKVSQLRQRLEQIKNVLMGKPSDQQQAGLVIDHSR